MVDPDLFYPEKMFLFYAPVLISDSFNQPSMSTVGPLNGAIEAIDTLLKICAQEEEAQAAADKPAESEGDPNA